MRPAQLKALVGAAIGVALIAGLRYGLDVFYGNLLIGLLPALASGLTAVALVLMYRTSRIINFSQIALGALSAQLFYQLYIRSLLPYGLAFLAAIVAGILVAVLVGTVAALLFYRHPRLVMTVVTISFIPLLADVQGRVNGIFVKPGEVQPTEAVTGPFAPLFELDQIPIRFVHVFGIGLMIAIAVGLAVFFRKTRIGIAIRASAENADRASLLGINVKLLLVGVWTLVGVLSSVGALAKMPREYNAELFFDQTALLLPLAAAVIARMSSMPLAFFSAVGIDLLQRGLNIWKSGSSAWVDLGLLGVLVLGLLLQRKQLNARVDDTTSWKATKEPRPTPREMVKLPAIGRTRIALLAVLGVILLGLPWMTDIVTRNTLQFIWIGTIIGVSVTILTGWTGQISLGQMAIASMGAFAGGYAWQHWGVPFLPALLVGGLAGAAFAFLIGIPALRIRGLFLAVATFAVAITLPVFLFEDRFLGQTVPKAGIERPSLFFLHFADERSMYYLCMVIAIIVVASVYALRKSRAGRVLIALRDNEAGVQSFGINIVRTRLIAFALSGFIAGLGGALLTFQQLGMGDVGQGNLFGTSFSINLFVLVVIGGVSSPIGAFLGTLYFIGGSLFFPGFAQLTTGILGLVVLMFIPGGLVQVVFGVRDSILRVVAMRQNIVVPSLFADYSPEAWEKRLAPLSPPVESHGLAALRHDQRYALASRIFGRAHA
ncbi:MAG TPA: ABC transporter permease [Actinomycetota bacterium]